MHAASGAYSTCCYLYTYFPAGVSGKLTDSHTSKPTIADPRTMGWPLKDGQSDEQISVHGTVEFQNDSGEETNGVQIQTKTGQSVRAIEKNRQFDLNLADEAADALREAARTDNLERVLSVDKETTEDSPYEAVRAAVRNTDGEEVANTVRAWVLGFIFVTASAGVNMFLSMRSPAIQIPTVVIMLLVYPFGCLWARVLPARTFKTFGLTWSTNPGPFTIKEHAVVTLMANVTYGYAYATDALLALDAKPLYNIHLGWGFQLLFTLSSQIIGIAISGVFRRFLVWPAALLWPTNFSMTTLLYAMHDKKKLDPCNTNGWTISGYRYFAYVTLCSFIWYWFPGVIWQGLSVFSFLTWIRPNDATINQLFGGFTGLSLIPLTFDWTYVIGYLGDPLLAPTFAHLNTLVGLFVFMILTTIGISYSGVLYTDYLPINTSTTFDNTQSQYNVTKIMTPDFSFDVAKYKKYSPLFLAPTFALNYGLSFAALTASIVHTMIFHGKEVWYRFKASRNQEPDVHMRLMKMYKEAPDW